MLKLGYLLRLTTSFADDFKSGSGAGITSLDTPTYYAIGDVHGHADALRDLLKKIKQDIIARKRSNPSFNPEIVFMGDYVDRGPKSKETLSILCEELELQKDDGIKRTVLKGNHDFIFEKFLTAKLPSEIFVMAANLINNGGLCTFAEYNIFFESKPEQKESRKCFSVKDIAPEFVIDIGQALDAQERMLAQIPEKHLKLMEKMVSSYDSEGFFFCHAGVNNSTSLKEQNELTILGIKQQTLTRSFSRSAGHPEKIVVTGHTIVDRIELTRTENGKGGRVSTDTGAFKTGTLSCAVLHNGKHIRSLKAQTGLPTFEQSFMPTPDCKYPRKSTTNLSQPLDVVGQQV
ncbi:MAG: metallophosphoesterase [Pseudobdellovibrionaceae bacterium]|jgi:serine/threonine protein phosphatase 1|nr:metallophosphoesterase [Pseudobdellovibrionaceae bacterium]